MREGLIQDEALMTPDTIICWVAVSSAWPPYSVLGQYILKRETTTTTNYPQTTPKLPQTSPKLPPNHLQTIPKLPQNYPLGY